MLPVKNEYNARIWEIGTLIKLVAIEDIRAISTVASRLRKHYTPEQLDNVDNNIIYDCYCNEHNKGVKL